MKQGEVAAENTATTGGSGGTDEAQQPAKPQDVLEYLKSKRGEKEVLALIPSDVITAFQKRLDDEGVAYRKIKKFHNHQYYYPKLIAFLRRGNSFWMAFDGTDTEFRANLDKFFLSAYRLDAEERFGDIALLHVINEMPDTERPMVQLEQVGRASGMPTNIEFSPSGDTMFTTTKSGVVEWLSMTNKKKKGTVVRLPSLRKQKEGVFVGGESGLVGLAIHPDYPGTPKMYLQYNWKYADGKREAILSEWDLAVSADKITASNERVLYRINQVSDNHNAGQLKFGPSDGYLYVAVGDGEEGKWTIGRAPAHTLRGKVLRIDVATRAPGKEYGIPADNPFVGQEGFPPETWAWGFRNPWRMSFTPDGRLIAGEIGEDRNEEVTFVMRGKHHGWPYIEGGTIRNEWTLGDEVPQQPSLFAYGRHLGMSVIGGYVYRGDSIEWLRGKYVFNDYLSGRMWAMELPPPGAENRTYDISEVQQLARWPRLLSTTGQHPNGEMFAGAHDGRIFQLKDGLDGSAPVENEPAEMMSVDALRGIFAVEFPAPAREAANGEVALGRLLYNDASLTANGASCATCHPLDRFGQDGKAKSPGTKRNAPPTYNAHRQYAQYRDYRAASVDEIVNEGALGHGGVLPPATIAKQMSKSADVTAAFEKAFPGETPTAGHVQRAIGSFLRTLETRSRWDEFLDGRDDALSKAELAGLNEFVTVGCVTCHQYRTLGGNMQQKLGLMKPWAGDDIGREAVTGERAERHFFKASALLNVEKTGPYYHDGSIATLDAAVRHMASAQLGRELSDAQTKSIVTFLKALTGEPVSAGR